jgi:hypothetical protein
MSQRVLSPFRFSAREESLQRVKMKLRDASERRNSLWGGENLGPHDFRPSLSFATARGHTFVLIDLLKGFDILGKRH